MVFVSEAFYKVYASSKEILKNDQRHLFCNMLDLLSSSCKVSTSSDKEISSDELILFWLSEVMPLIFDEDESIQKSAVVALENALLALDIPSVHSCAFWSKLKRTINNVYAPRIHQIRENRCNIWHRAWCLLIRILDCEIIKDSTTINIFLSIVEYGFRSTDDQIRIEAFTCWRSLIEIFSFHNEINAPKRLKLVKIPLKSSHSKSPLVTEVQFRVWWYLVTRFGDKLGIFFEAVVNPFMSFIYTRTFDKHYPDFRQLALPCVATLLSTEPNEYLQCILKERKLESICQPSSFISTALRQHWKLISNTVLALISSTDVTDCPNDEVNLKNLLLRYIVISMLHMDLPCYTQHICQELEKISASHPHYVIAALNILATENNNISFSLEDNDNYSAQVCAFSNFFKATKSLIPQAILNRCIEKVCAFESFDTDRKLVAIAVVLKLIIQKEPEDDYHLFDTRFSIWRVAIDVLLEFLNNHDEERVKSAEDINIFSASILWPLQMSITFIGHRNQFNFDAEFCRKWKQLVKWRLCYPGQSHFLSDIEEVLLQLILNRLEELYLTDIFDAYVLAVQEIDSDKNYLHHKTLLAMLKNAVDNVLPQKKLEYILNCLSKILSNLKQSAMTILLDDIKSTLHCVIIAISKSGITPVSYTDWKQQILQAIELHANEDINSQIGNILNSSMYMVTPELKGRNSDKLTELLLNLYRSAKQTSPEAENDTLLEQNHEITESKRRNRDHSANQNISEINNERDLVAPRLEYCNLLQMDADKIEIEKINLDRNTNGKDYKVANNVTNPKTDVNETTESTQIDSVITPPKNKRTANADENTFQNLYYNIKEDSPKKCSLKYSLLQSPPDRKLTNNNNSPTLRHKLSHLTGRGAQFINMIRNKRLENPSAGNSPSIMVKANLNNVTCEKVQMEPFDVTSTPVQVRITTPKTSASGSILKKRSHLENLDDSMDSPVLKKKRVSFHDPPVSLTKEFISGVSATKKKPKRCLELDKICVELSPQLRRDLKSAYKQVMKELPEVDTEKNMKQSVTQKTTDGDNASLNIKNFDSPRCSKSRFRHREEILQDDAIKELNAHEALQIVTEKFTLDEVLQKYLHANNSLSEDSLNAILNITLQNVPQNEIWIKTLFDKLFQNNLQEHEDVDHIDVNYLIQYVSNKAKQDQSCFNNLLKHVLLVFENKPIDTCMSFLKDLLLRYKLSDTNIVDILSYIIKERNGKYKEAMMEN